MFPQTKQEIFDGVVDHLRKQGCKSITPNAGICRFRGPNGTKCAVGAFIPDDVYKPHMENISTIREFIASKLEASKPFIKEQELWYDLQWVHDMNSVNEWEDRFKETATKFNLIYTPPVL